MEIMVKRMTRTSESTLGSMFVNGEFECFTLEDAERASKIYGRTAIPKGRYEVVISWSNRFQQYMPLLLNVPDFEGIRIHAGNDSADTLGCILVGRTRSPNWIGESRLAYVALMKKLRAVEKKEKIFITVE